MKENKKIFQKTSNSNKGITLVALVITIVILIILATVAINFAFGNNGLINRASDAKEYYANDTAYTEEALSNVESYIDGILGENGGSEPEEPGTSTTVEEAKKNETKFDKTTTIKDGQDNNVVIPGGFHVDKDSGTNVEDGIVIEDDIGNQFVWIPVGEYKVSTTINAEGKLTNNLSRRTFTLEGATEVSNDDVINSDFYGEGYDYSVAKDTIGAFKTSATNNGGFYIGRYETGTETKRKTYKDELTTPEVQESKYVYNYVSRDEAKALAEELDKNSAYIESELVSSYAWDTALNFICQINGYRLVAANKDYGNIGTSSLKNTGMYEADNYCNIYDIVGNVREWTTEYGRLYRCVARGGYYDHTNYSADDRSCTNTNGINFNSTYSCDFIGFRIQLYIK